MVQPKQIHLLELLWSYLYNHFSAFEDFYHNPMAWYTFSSSVFTDSSQKLPRSLYTFTTVLKYAILKIQLIYKNKKTCTNHTLSLTMRLFKKIAMWSLKQPTRTEIKRLMLKKNKKEVKTFSPPKLLESLKVYVSQNIKLFSLSPEYFFPLSTGTSWTDSPLLLVPQALLNRLRLEKLERPK